MKPLVSAVIPTYNRPQFVVRAVRSALNQTLQNIEVIVVIDGPDEATRKMLAEVADPRLKVIELPSSQGATEARNRGVAESQAEWIAFLDDDDEWLPEKLERQLATASSSDYALPIVICRLVARTPRGDFIWPRRLFNSSEPISEYLLVRKGLFRGEGHISTTVIFAKKDLLQMAPFKGNLRKHQDFEWILRVTALEGVGIETVAEPLAIWYTEEKRNSLSANNNWEYSLSVIREKRDLVTPRAYSAFIVTEVAPPAARAGDRKAFWLLLKEMIQVGQPRILDLLLYFGMWLIPQETRRWLKALLTKRPKISAIAR